MRPGTRGRTIVTASVNAVAGGGSDIVIEDWRPAGAGASGFDADVDMLADILRAVVYDGAGVSFVAPFSHEDGRAFWLGTVWPGVEARTRRVLVARSAERIVGTVQLVLQTPPNGRHRAEVVKLLVHPGARRRGIARRLMLAIEEVARAESRTLLTLDTWTGSHAEALYRSLGYLVAGVIPRYARGSVTPELEPTTIMYKELPSGSAGGGSSAGRQDR